MILRCVFVATLCIAAFSQDLCHVDWPEKCVNDIGKVDAALVSADTLWEFITSPDTDYFDRVVAASRGVKLMSAEWIPKLFQAKQQLLSEAALYSFGVQPPPLDARGWYMFPPRRSVGAAINRTILGRPYIVPEQWIAYPETPQQFRQSPWPFQVAQAIGIYFGGLYGFVVDASDPAILETIAPTLPCNDFESARDLIKLTLTVARKQGHVSPEIFGTWLNASHNHNGNVDYAASGIMLQAATALGGKTVTDSWAMLQALGLEELDLGETGLPLSALPAIQPTPNTLVLAIARKIVMNGAPTAKAEAFLHAVGQPVPRSSTASDELATWLAQNQAMLEQTEAAERPSINRAREQISNVGGCKP